MDEKYLLLFLEELRDKTTNNDAPIELSSSEAYAWHYGFDSAIDKIEEKLKGVLT
jgi:hypothetical protein